MIRGALIAVALLLSWAHAYPLAGQPGAVTAAHSVQGALVDIRYGQVCLDHGGISSVLETLPQTRIWLDGSPITADDLQKRVPEGLIAVATGPGNGFVDSLEVYTGGLRLPAVGVEALPWIGPAYRAGETLTLLLPESEVKRARGRQSCPESPRGKRSERCPRSCSPALPSLQRATSDLLQLSPADFGLRTCPRIAQPAGDTGLDRSLLTSPAP